MLSFHHFSTFSLSFLLAANGPIKCISCEAEKRHSQNDCIYFSHLNARIGKMEIKQRNEKHITRKFASRSHLAASANTRIAKWLQYSCHTGKRTKIIAEWHQLRRMFMGCFSVGFRLGAYFLVIARLYVSTNESSKFE